MNSARVHCSLLKSQNMWLGEKKKKKEGKKCKRGSANADSNGYIEGELKDLNVGCGISIFFGMKLISNTIYIFKFLYMPLRIF